MWQAVPDIVIAARLLSSSSMDYAEIVRLEVLEQCYLKLEIGGKFRTHTDALSLSTIRYGSVTLGKRSSEFVVVLLALFRVCLRR